MSPFKSLAQMKWMYANKPAMAERWSSHTPKGKLPKHVKKKKNERSRITRRKTSS